MKKKIPGDIELIVYDFDGVMTDNRIILREDGLESVVVNRSDGLAVSIIKKSGIRQMILSTEQNNVVTTRAKKLKIPVFQGVNDKKEFLKNYCKENNISLEDVAYVGNDLNDLEVMRIMGYPICPLDACKKIKNISKVVLKTRGGAGVVRELLDLLEDNGIK